MVIHVDDNNNDLAIIRKYIMNCNETCALLNE